MKKNVKLSIIPASRPVPRSFSKAGSLCVGWCVIFLLISVICVPQNVGINIVIPDPSALLDLTSTEQGFLIPRMTTGLRDAISNPAESLLIFNTTTECFEFYYDGSWYEIGCTTETFTCGTSTVDDIEGNTYNTILIGTQCWLKENMRTTKYPDNSAITKGDKEDDDSELIDDWDIDHAWYSCPPNTANNAEDCAAAASMGLLYQWSAAMYGAASCNGTGSSQPECSSPVQGICPDGWHIPSHYEWRALEQQICSDNGGGSCSTDFPYDETTASFCGTNGEGSDMAGDDAIQDWTNSCNAHDDNTDCGDLDSDSHFEDSGLDIFSSGARGTAGNYDGRAYRAYLWTSTEYQIDVTRAWRRYIRWSQTNALGDNQPKSMGYAVRCVLD